MLSFLTYYNIFIEYKSVKYLSIYDKALLWYTLDIAADRQFYRPRPDGYYNQ
ncbi:hypothetical protein D3C86_1310550 [compost metagenome]